MKRLKIFVLCMAVTMTGSAFADGGYGMGSGNDAVVEEEKAPQLGSGARSTGLFGSGSIASAEETDGPAMGSGNDAAFHPAFGSGAGIIMLSYDDGCLFIFSYER